jgi:hypothetical protein
LAARRLRFDRCRSSWLPAWLPRGFAVKFELKAQATVLDLFELAGEGSNLQPPDPKSGVLPIELPATVSSGLTELRGLPVRWDLGRTCLDHRRGTNCA